LALTFAVYTRQQFLEFQSQRSINSRDSAIKALKWFDKYLSSIGETESTIWDKLEPIKGKDEFYLFLNAFDIGGISAGVLFSLALVPVGNNITSWFCWHT